MPNEKNFQRSIPVLLRYLARRQGFLIRAGLCLVIGIIVLFNNQLTNFDSRLQFRGNQDDSQDIVLITISYNEIPLNSALRQQTTPLSEYIDYTDSYYWNLEIWSKLLEKILKSDPRKIGVSMVFADSAVTGRLTTEQKNIFLNPKIIWAGLTAQNDRAILPKFAKDNYTNVGAIELQRDDDGMIRRFPSQRGEFDLMSAKLAEISSSPPSKSSFSNQSNLINYRGDGRTFREYSLTDILSDNILPAQLKDKIIIIGTEPSRQSLYLTPMGTSTRHAVIAHMTDHLLRDRHIRSLSRIFYSLLLVILLSLTILMISRYPQSVALVFLVWIATLWTALSAWVFDSYYFWIPVMAPITMMAATYIVFLGYQANKIERKHLLLKQEQKYHLELEQLKNNFVSLISHDLKTPIAKIQAVLNRLMSTQDMPSGVKGDLNLLQQSNEELNKYIHSILQMLRVESRDFKLHIEVGDTNEIISQVVNQLRPLANEKNISIELKLEPMFSSEFDHTLIREVLVNLVENAIKYTPPNGNVKIITQESENQVYVEVADTGEGIRESEVNLVWGKFVRGKDQDLRTKGTGLGLYLVKFFIELHGGKVSLSSQRGQGTKVSFVLPIEHTEKMKELT